MKYAKAKILERIQTLTAPIHPEPTGNETRLQKLDDIQCVAFDFYGTMFISGAGGIGVDNEQKATYQPYLREALKRAGFSNSSTTATKKGVLEFQKTIEQSVKRKKEEGVNFPEPNIIEVWQEVLTALAKLNFIKGPITKNQAIWVAVEFEFRANTVWPVPSLRNTLEELLNRQITLGILSNSQFYTPLTFEALIGQATDDFGFDPDLQKWSYQEGIKKPSARFYSTFTDELSAKNVAAGEVLYVGNDLFKDIIPAKKMGMKTALYVGDTRSLRHKSEDLACPDHQPDIIIDGLHQIIECLV